MYSLDINFLKDRPAFQKNTDRSSSTRRPAQPGSYVPVYIGVGVGLLFPALAYAGLVFLQMKTGELDQTIGTLTEQVKQLDQKIADIKKLQGEANRIQEETKALVTVFDQIRPWSAMLQDLGDRIPAAVQMENIRQIEATPPANNQAGQPAEPPRNPLGELEITGYARSFNDVNDFLLSLQQSKFLNATESRIISTELADAPLIDNTNQSPGLIKPQVVKYTIRTGLSVTPASELLQELERKGSVGLRTRIITIKEKGVIP
ncbi:MAG TPA: PilN domain-containing protein [Nostocaceae cyanobacterium]|nr:PilN domain-containing protein [Nostocaceae cyanobacterium]